MVLEKVVEYAHPIPFSIGIPYPHALPIREVCLYTCSQTRADYMEDCKCWNYEVSEKTLDIKDSVVIARDIESIWQATLPVPSWEIQRYARGLAWKHQQLVAQMHIVVAQLSDGTRPRNERMEVGERGSRRIRGIGGIDKVYEATKALLPPSWDASCRLLGVQEGQPIERI